MRRLLVPALVLAPAVLFAQEADEHPAAGLPPPPPGLSAEERQAAVDAATTEQPIQSFVGLMESMEQGYADGRLIVSEVAKVGIDKGEGRLALVTLYRYADDTTIRRLVDLETGEVVRETVEQGVMPRITETEIDLAKALLREDPRIRDIVGAPLASAQIEVLPARFPDPDDPLFGRRVVHPLFRFEDGYADPTAEIYVDLTAGEIVLRD